AIAKTLNFQQAGEFYRSLSAQDQADLIRNLSGDLAKVRNVETSDIMLSHFYKADCQYGERLAKALKVEVKEIERRAALLQE
ncbi:catalase, partial [Pseudomonas sp. MWU13-2860]